MKELLTDYFIDKLFNHIKLEVKRIGTIEEKRK